MMKVVEEIAVAVPLEGVSVSMELAIMLVLPNVTFYVTGRMLVRVVVERISLS